MISLFRRTTFFTLLCAIVLTLTACAGTPEPAGPWIAGTWHGQYYGNNTLMSFGVNGEFSMYSQGALVKGTYTIDTTVTPNLLDIAMEGSDVVTTIVQLQTDGTFLFENNLPAQPRPHEFSDSIIFSRREEGAPPPTSHPIWTVTPAVTP